jgi:hypothetical protein
MTTTSSHIDHYDLSGCLGVLRNEEYSSNVFIPVVFTLSFLWINKDKPVRLEGQNRLSKTTGNIVSKYQKYTIPLEGLKKY